MADSPLLQKHHQEIARATAAAMQQHFSETVEICSELITSDLYTQMEAAGLKQEARQAKAETRLMMATAMHYTDCHHDDVLKVLNYALDSPPAVQKDVYFTIAVVQLSAERPADARVAMQTCLTLISDLKRAGAPEAENVDQQEREALEFLEQLAPLQRGPVN